MPNAVHSISIPSSTRHLGKVRRFVERYAIEADFPDEIINSLQLAVDEACANIIEHAYTEDQTPAGSRFIDIDVIIKPDRFIVRIRDKGRAFETNKYREPDIFRYAKTKKAGGFGVHLMRQLMDQVEYRTRGDSNECCLIKYRSNSDSSSSKTAAKRTKSEKTATGKSASRASTGKKSTSGTQTNSVKSSTKAARPGSKSTKDSGAGKSRTSGKRAGKAASKKNTAAKPGKRKK